MKRIFALVICVFFIFLTGCNQNSNPPERDAVKINMPADNSVNGYRVSKPETNGMPDIIAGSNTSVGTVEQNNSDAEYCANKNSKVFHKSTCGSVEDMKEENRAYYSDRDQLIKNGYSPCKRCNP